MIWQFDADHVAARNGGDTRRHRAHRTGHVVGQRNHAARLHAGGRLEFIQRDHGTGAHGGDAALDAEIGQHRFQHAGIFFQRFIRKRVGILDRHRLGQQAQRRKFIVAGRQIQRRLLVGALGGFFGTAHVALDAIALALRQARRGDGLGPYCAGALFIVAHMIGAFVIIFILMVGIVFIVVMMIGRSESRLPDQIPQPDRAAGNALHARHDGHQAQARGEEGQRQARQQEAQWQRPAQHRHLPHLRGMHRKAMRGDADHAACARRKSGGLRKQAKACRHGDGAQRPGHQPPHGILDRLAAQGAPAPHELRRQEGQCRNAEDLQHQIGGHRAQRAQPVADIVHIGVVQAGVTGRIAGQRDQGGEGRQHQREACAPERHHAGQAVHGALGVGQGIAHGAALGARVIDSADHLGLRHAKPAR